MTTHDIYCPCYGQAEVYWLQCLCLTIGYVRENERKNIADDIVHRALGMMFDNNDVSWIQAMMIAADVAEGKE